MVDQNMTAGPVFPDDPRFTTKRTVKDLDLAGVFVSKEEFNGIAEKRRVAVTRLMMYTALFLILLEMACLLPVVAIYLMVRGV